MVSLYNTELKGSDVVVVVVDVVVSPPTTISTKLLQPTEFDLTLIVVVPAGTKLDVYPASRDALDIPLSNADPYPVTFESKLKLPVSAPAVVN
jgi:hypothetical protein